MSTCLVTKLKAVVDNPNLPILETMQQFTLDAIASSGNISMTDDQKWALNHFFYRIGAISNTGIFPKLQILGLSFIAGNKAGALTDYARGLEATGVQASVTFSNGGFVAPANATTIASHTWTTGSVDSNYFFFIAGSSTPPAGIRFRSNGVRYDSGTEQDVDVVYGSSLVPGGLFLVAPSPYVQYSAYIQADVSSVTSILGASMNVVGHQAQCVAFNSTSVEILPVSTYREIEEGVRVSGTSPVSNIDNNAPYSWAFGSNLTNEEQLLFSQEMQTLINAFNV